MFNKDIKPPAFTEVDKADTKIITVLADVMIAIGVLGLVLVTVFINYYGC